MRTPLDQVLVEGIFRREGGAKTLTINDVAKMIAPALIDGIDLDADSRFAADQLEDFRHFLRRMEQKWKDAPAGFGVWLRQEREKGFVRLLPGFKKFSKIDREGAREKGTRFYRRVLWASYEAMSRCFGVVALHMWVSFFESEVICPSVDEQRAFRCYQAPLVLAAGMPLWFFGPNVLRWVMEGFIEKVWGWGESQDFDPLTHLIALYGQTARERRGADATKKRMNKVSQNRSDLLERSHEVHFEEAKGGGTITTRVPTVPPMELREDADADCPDLPPSRACSCGGRLVPVGKPESRGSWVLVDTECAACGREQTYRVAQPS